MYLSLLTEHTDRHVDHAGGMLRGRGRRVQDGLQGGAAPLQHVKVRLRLCEVRLPLLRGEIVPLTGACPPLHGSIGLVPGQHRS